MDTTRYSSSDFRRRATLGVAITVLLLLTPFAINNFVQGRAVLGAGSLAIVIVMSILAIGCVRGFYNPLLTFAGLAPTILVVLALDFQRQGIIAALWCFPAALVFYCVLEERYAWLANAALVTMALPMAWWVFEPPIALRVAATLVTVSVIAAVFVRVITLQRQALEALAVTDPLTGLANRALLPETLERAIARGQRTGAYMSLVALDIDHFKVINDTRGHDAGDAVLREVAGVLHERLRKADRAFRIGGEEFLVLLDGADAEDARAVAEELRTSLASRKLESGLEVTASFGVAAWHAGETVDAWMKRADQMLYCAKAEGRNLVRA
jgi:diguanylate cyclase (GGDEF)-like protein